MLEFIRPSRLLPNGTWGQTTKRGGVSGFGESCNEAFPFQQNTLNLATHVNDAPKAVSENWRRFALASPWSRETLATCQQVHGTEILEVSEGGHHHQNADALISRMPGVAVGVFTADCVPILIVDPERKHVAAVHCGWKGAAAKLTMKTIDQLVGDAATRRKTLLVWIGAAIRCESYEVGPEVALQFNEMEYEGGKPGKFQLDLPKAIRHQLLAAGISTNHIEDCSIDTYASNKILFSYRADGQNTGRMLTFAGFLG